MSKCMTLADETIEQKGTSKEIDAKDIVEFILEEALISAVNFSDKGCNRIGDFNITEDFCQQFDEIPANSKNFDVDKIKSDSGNKDGVNFNSGETVDRLASLVTAKENLDFILDSLPRKDDRLKSVNECKVITREALADDELRIENGQIHIERNKSHNVRSSFPDAVRREFYEKKDVIKDEKIEIEYFNDGKLNKIYVPLSKANKTSSGEQGSKEEHVVPQGTPRSDANNTEESMQRPFAPFSTEELRQVWENANSSIVGGWDGDMSSQPEEVARIMEELSSVQVFSNSSADPNRPRTCEFGEESVKKMTKEIEEINFNQSHNTSEDLDSTCHPDGQGDADLDTKSFTKSKEAVEKSSKAHKDQDESSLSEDLRSKSLTNPSRDDLENPSLTDRKNEEILLSSQLYVTPTKPEDSPTEGKDKRMEGKDSSVDTLVVSPSIKLNTEEYLIESESSSDRSILIGQSENEKSMPRSVSGNLNVSLGSGTEVVKVKRSGEEIVLCAMGGELLEEKGDDPTANRLNSREKVEEEEKPKRKDSPFGPCSREKVDEEDKPKRKDSPFGPCNGNPSLLGHYSSHLRESETSLRKSHKTSDLSLKGFKLPPEAKASTEFSSSDPFLHSTKSMKNLESGRDYVTDANSLSRISKSATGNPSTCNARNDHSNAEEDLIEAETRSKKLFEEVLEIDSLTGEREIQMPCCDAHLLSRMDREISDLEIITKSENYSPTGDLSRERFIDDFEDIVCRSNIRTEPTKYGKEENPMESKSDDQQRDIDETEEINLKIKQLQKEKEYLIQQEEDYPPDDAYSYEDATENESSSITTHRTFKLHSQKMYLDSALEPTNLEGKKFPLTDSEEAFIDSTENVIQVIDPHDNSNDEDSGAVFFSLLNENADEGRIHGLKTDTFNVSELSISSTSERTPSQNENFPKRNVFSGMTTIGPMKNLDVDPKDLTGPEIDFGKMTRISSSRQLAKDLFPTEVKSTSSRRIFEEHESDGESSLTIEGERLEIGSLINRDIASLTKVQKVKEVMSYHPKADEDFEDDDTLTRPRLDLKDVESMTDERFKMTDVNIPLLSFEMANTNSETDKEYLQGMHLVLSGNCFSNSTYYVDDIDEDNVQTFRNRPVIDGNPSDVKNENKNEREGETPESVTAEEGTKESDNPVEEKKSDGLSEEASHPTNSTPEQDNQGSEKDSRDGSGTSHQKYGTLGSVFKKASSRIIRKDSDLFLRNSKSLPRDASRISTSDSIRSILEDCHSSATNVLKKSRSLLKSTQSIFKTMSQNRFGAQTSSTTLTRQRMTSSDTDANAEANLDRKPSGFQWKEDFSKAKTLIKNKVGKTFKSSERSSTQDSDLEFPLENKDLRLSVRNEEDYRVERAENFRKLLSKSPLTYKSQFVRSQMSVHAQDDFTSVSSCDVTGSQQKDEKNDSKTVVDEESGGKTQTEDSGGPTNEDTVEEKVAETEPEPSKEEKKTENDLTWTGEQTGEGEAVEGQQPGEQPEYIVMETIQGLPTVDLENYSYETDRQKDKTSLKTEATKGNEDDSKRYQRQVSNYPQHTPACSPFASDTEEEKTVGTSPPESKARARNKKFTARFRSFWSSAFGKVKTSPKNKEPS